VIDSQRAAIFLVSLVLLGCLAAVLRWSWFGLALRTVGQSPKALDSSV